MAYKNILNNCKCLFAILFLITVCMNSANCLEPIIIGTAIGAGALGFNFFKDQTYCRVYECCDDRSISANIDSMKKYLYNYVQNTNL